MNMSLVNYFKKGMIILSIYVIFVLYLFVAAERIDRLEDNGFIEEKSGISVKIGK